MMATYMTQGAARSDSDGTRFPTPSETRGDKARHVVFVDRFPAVFNIVLQDHEILQDKLRDIIGRARHAPRPRDAWELHSLACDVLESLPVNRYRHVITRGDTRQQEIIRKRLVAMHVEVHGAL